MTDTVVDTLIIGQGLAGTLFAHECAKRGHRLMVIDSQPLDDSDSDNASDNAGSSIDRSTNHSIDCNVSRNASQTAAGMYNPVVLKRFSPVWQGREQIATARQTVAELEALLAVKLDYPLPILRVFHDAQEKITWTNKAAKLDGLLDAQFTDKPSDAIRAPHGVGCVHFGGRVDLYTLLTAYRHHLQQQGSLRNEQLDYQQLVPEASGFRYGDIVAKRVVCCEGYGVKANPYFNDLPLNGNKGEVLTVRLKNLSLSAAIKSNIFIMPLPEQGNDVYFVGATYDWTHKDNTPTIAARTQLLDKLKQLVIGDIEVLSHRAAMRPTVIDRRPLLGRHPDYHDLYILNGLGTRGVMLGATMAQHLSRFIDEQVALPAEVDIVRFASLED